MATKDFLQELKNIEQRLKSGQKFAFSKYADGEWAIMNNHPITAQGEFQYQQQDIFYSNKLLESYRFKDDGYYIGISCPCCQGMETHKRMLLSSKQKQDHVTFANVFVNSNYPYYVDNVVPFYSTQKVVLVCNRNGKVANLPFKPEKVYPIDHTAFKTNFGLVEEMKNDVKDVTNHLYLFCAGPLGNMLAAELWKTNKENVYLDIGSTLNPWLQCEGHKRDYYIGKDFSRQVCVWGE
jgi:hypothetical protein